MTAPGPSTPPSAAADYLVDRRRLRRGLFAWRIAALLGVLVAVVGIAAGFGLLRSGPYIARVKIEGVITGDSDTLKQLERLAGSDAVAVILDINSPGGTTTGAEELYDGIRRLGARKPVVAVVGTMAASGGYIAALGADHIVSHSNSIVGSIGVLFTYPNLAKLLDNIGVKVEEIKSSPLKAAPNGLSPTSEEARAALAAVVGDSFDWFKGLVKERRRMSDQELAKVADGRVFTGRQSVPLKLVDRLGGEPEAIAWLVQERNIPKNLKVLDSTPTSGKTRWGMFGALSGLSQMLGLEGTARLLERAATRIDASSLDGLVSVWHAAPE